MLTLDRKYIEQSGATTATELIQSLPQVQNFVANSAAVNGGGAGNTTASLHALPSKYTLVLIDGVVRRSGAQQFIRRRFRRQPSTVSRWTPWSAWKSCWTAQPRCTAPTRSPA